MRHNTVTICNLPLSRVLLEDETITFGLSPANAFQENHVPMVRRAVGPVVGELAPEGHTIQSQCWSKVLCPSFRNGRNGQ